jgi:hypothetical protein
VPPPLDVDEPELEPAAHDPAEQVRPDRVQSMHVPPPLPHVVLPVPDWQAPPLSQQPLQLVGLHGPASGAALVPPSSPPASTAEGPSSPPLPPIELPSLSPV